MDINRNIVCVTMSRSRGHAQLENMLSAMNIPIMSAIFTSHNSHGTCKLVKRLIQDQLLCLVRSISIDSGLLKSSAACVTSRVERAGQSQEEIDRGCGAGGETWQLGRLPATQPGCQLFSRLHLANGLDLVHCEFSLLRTDVDNAKATSKLVLLSSILATTWSLSQPTLRCFFAHLRRPAQLCLGLYLCGASSFDSRQPDSDGCSEDEGGKCGWDVSAIITYEENCQGACKGSTQSMKQAVSHPIVSIGAPKWGQCVHPHQDNSIILKQVNLLDYNFWEQALCQCTPDTPLSPSEQHQCTRTRCDGAGPSWLYHEQQREREGIEEFIQCKVGLYKRLNPGQATNGVLEIVVGLLTPEIRQYLRQATQRSVEQFTRERSCRNEQHANSPKCIGRVRRVHSSCMKGWVVQLSSNSSREWLGTS
ncbi:hypothetical protein PR048_012893 [Dryococelus australis]|uniref:Uncharacterized protein n=1 Tax=Dryococelus australis TaxID=614101 RepID=A0ABQ9HQN7_9NEOP|nr:hypothetical protein PR048_012893 [Dryococelus australis]